MSQGPGAPAASSPEASPAGGPPSPVPFAQAETDEPGLTLRSFLIGGALLLFWSYVTGRLALKAANELRMYYTLLTIGFAALLTLFFARVLNEAVRRVLKGTVRPLTKNELTVVFAMLLVGIPAGLSMRGALESAMMINWADFNSVKDHRLSEWAPPHWRPDASSTDVADFLKGQVGVPWGLWARPFAFWGAYLLSFYLLSYFACLFFRSAWVDDEKLAFPLSRIPFKILEERPRDRVFTIVLWAAFAVGLLFCLPGINSIRVAESFPDRTPVDPDMGHYSFVPFPGLSLYVGPLVLMALLFLSADLLLTAAIAYFFVSYVLQNMLSLDDKTVAFVLRRLIFTGGMLGLCFFTIWFQRREIWAFFRGAFRGPGAGGGNGAGGSRDPHSRPVVLAGALVSLGAFLTMSFWGAGEHFPWWAAFFTVALILAVNFAYARLRAEIGYEPHDAGNLWQVQLFGVSGGFSRLAGGGAAEAGAVGLFATRPGWMTHGMYWHFAGSLKNLGAHLFFLDLFNLASLTRTRARHVGLAVLASIVISMPATGAVYLNSVYAYGDEEHRAEQNWNNQFAWTYFSYNQGVADDGKPKPADDWEYVWGIPIGFGIVGLLLWCRREIRGFPIHPVGFVMAGCLFNKRSFMGTSEIWFTFLFIAFIKILLFRWFGVRFFQEKALPFAAHALMGLTLGVVLYLAAIAWFLDIGWMTAK